MNNEHIAFLVFISICIIYILFQTPYNHKIINDGYKVIASNDDKFYDKLNKINLTARNVKTIEDYKKKIKRTCIDVNANKRMVIHNAIKHIKTLDIDASWIDNKKFHDMPWNIIITKDYSYEGGLPHTRSNNTHGQVIIIPYHLLLHDKELINTLFHEQLHVYQKTYTKQLDKYIYKHYDEVTNIDTSLMRANPDTDNKIYQTKAGKTYCCEYNNKNPKSLFDVTFKPINKSKFEHPYEKMVYDLVKQTI